MIPLYELVHSAQSHKESAPLVKRVSGIFKNKLCHMKNVSGSDKVAIVCERMHSGKCELFPLL